jgi:sugar lactone lactonase YvrE
MGSPHQLALSPDGRFAYGASAASNALVVLRRNVRTGTIAEPAGSVGCVQEGGSDGCARGRALGNVHSVVLDRGAGTLYAAAQQTGAVAAFARNRRTGAIRQLRGRPGCIGVPGSPGCAGARGLDGVHSLALSPDGRQLYAAAEIANAAVTLIVRARR